MRHKIQPIVACAEHGWSRREIRYLRAPDADQSAILAVDRISCGYRHMGYGSHCPCMLRLSTAAQVKGSFRRIGADHQQVCACGEALMAGAGRQNGNIAGAQFHDLAVIAAEADAGLTACDAENLMDLRMVVQIIIDAVSPRPAPAMAMEELLENSRRIIPAL